MAKEKKKDTSASLRDKKAVTQYTIDWPDQEWKRVKALAALRGQSIREFLYACVSRELEEADRRNEWSGRA